jgi:hypothetical protein
MAVASCGSSPAEPDDDSVALPQGSTLVFQGEAAGFALRDRLETLVRETYDEARSRLPLGDVRITLRTGRGGGVIPAFGFGGRADDRAVTITFLADPGAWEDSVEPELRRLLLHELHHVARFRTIGFNRHLLDALVAEGLADRFMVEVAGGSPPPWALSLSGSLLDEWWGRARSEWLQPGYDHAAWFFILPDPPVPTWAGYAVGYALTGCYLDRHPERRGSAAHDRPSSVFADCGPP